MVEFLYEYDDTTYVHWSLVLAICAILVYYMKETYCAQQEGYRGNPFMGAFDQTAAGIDKIEQDHPGLMLSASGRTSIYGVPAIDENAKFSERFLAGREAPWITAPDALNAHTYAKAVQEAERNAAAGFHAGKRHEGFGDMSSSKVGLSEDDVQYLLNK